MLSELPPFIVLGIIALLFQLTGNQRTFDKCHQSTSIKLELQDKSALQGPSINNVSSRGTPKDDLVHNPMYIPYESPILGQLLDLISPAKINLFGSRFQSYDP